MAAQRPRRRFSRNNLIYKIMSTNYDVEEAREKRQAAMWVALSIIMVVAVVIAAMAFVPNYRVWSEGKRGEAEYMRAEQNRRIKVEEAKANLEAERLNAQAEVERAKGAAEAIKIENGSITPTYIQYLWVRQQNANTNNRIIYIPTEAGLPILEAGK
jgi:hypothetical protein